MKGKTGIQPFPASGNPTAGFSLPLKCERRQQVAAYSSSEFLPIKKDTQGVYIKGIQPFPASGNFINCSEGIRSATFRLLLVLNFIIIFTLIFCHNVAITPGLQTTVSSVVWSARSPWKPRHCFTSRLPTRSNPLSAMSKQNEQANFCLFVLFGGSEGIRTPEPVKTTRFPIVPVMTTSIRFHITFLF